MAKSTDSAIFLHRVSFSESSLVTTFYTHNSGLQTYLFQGGKKKSQSLFPLALCELTAYYRADSSMGKLSSADPLDLLLDIQTNPMKSVIAFFIADVIRQVVRDGQEDKLLFDFLKKQIYALDKTDKSGLFVLSFLCQLTEPLGIQPVLGDFDASYFVVKDGEFSRHMPIDSNSFGGEGVPLLQQIFRGDNVLIENIRAKRDALHVILNYYTFHLPGFNVDRSLEIVMDTLYS